MYFNGVDDYVRSATTNFQRTEASGSVSFKVVASDTDEVFFSVSSEAATNIYLYVTSISNQLFFRIIDGANFHNAFFLDFTLSLGVAYDIEVGSTGTAYYFMVDGVAVAIDAVRSGVDNGNWFGDMINQTDNVVVGRLIRSSNNGYASGVVNNVVVKNAVGTEVLNWAGDGNANVNWEDDAGSFDGTVNGSPALYTGQDVNGFVNHDYTGIGTNDTSQTTAADRPKIVQAGSLITDGNGNTSILFEATDDLDFDNAFTGLTAASIYAVTDNAGTVTLDTLTSQDITAVTTMNGLLTSLTYDKVTAVFIAPDNTDEALIQARLNSIYGA